MQTSVGPISVLLTLYEELAIKSMRSFSVRINKKNFFVQKSTIFYFILFFVFIIFFSFAELLLL